MSTPDPVPNTSPAAGPPPLAPGRIGVTDVQRIEDANRAFRALDYQYGGGACHDAVVDYLPWGRRTVDPTYSRSAIPALSTAINGYGQDMTRSRSFNLISLATNHLLEDDIDHAATVGAQAVAVSESVKTARTKDRLRPLKREADKRWNNADARVLSERIATFTATEAGCCWTRAAPPPQPCTPSCGSPCERVWRPRIPSVPAA